MNNIELNTEEANKAIVQRLYNECFNQGKFELVDQVISAGLVTPGPHPGRGPEGFKTNAMRLLTGFPDVQFTVQHLIAENDRVIAYWIWEGTHRGAFANIPPTGKKVRQEGMVMYRFVEGKVVEAKAIFDRLNVFQQLGVPPSAETAKA
jgi:steroid delta-isomerase-like uncharacterized protein